MLRSITAFLALLLLVPLTAATAQQREDPYARCAAMTQDAARLACFDETYATQRVVVAQREEEREARREEVFGFRDRDRLIERTEDDVTMSSAVSEVLQGSRREQVILLENGQLWRQVNGGTMRSRVRQGWVATISRHWSGAYEMRFEQGSGYLRVARVN
ncbi:MAG: hypothetical protein KDE15_05850 [Erythrobacter sp.]|nr:hypothetical protein [Erythrobacter sp.]